MRRKNRSAARRQAAGSRPPKSGLSLSAALESLERRSMLAADLLDVVNVSWNGQQVDAVRDEYVLRMPQTNVPTAKSPLDYACATPAARTGWSVTPLGSGFFKLTAPGATETAIMTWASRKGVASIDVNRAGKAAVLPSDPLYNSNPNNWGFFKINADKAWDTGTGTASTVVAVLDSGVNYNHPDLAGNMWQNPGEVPGDLIDNDLNGYVDDIYGINAITGSSDPMDTSGHGTFVAGLIGAVGNNGVGSAGVNWSVGLMAVKVMDAAGTVSTAAEVRGINYVLQQKLAGQGVAVANLSYDNGTSFVQQQADALNQLARAGVTIVAAAGNQARNIDRTATYPASLTSPGLIAVAASTRNDTLADFSNYGATSVDLAAPGVDVLSTRLLGSPTGTYAPVTGTPEYGVASGTSFAAPLVAGTAALLKSLRPNATVDQIKKAILDGADKVNALTGKVLTGGRLNVKNAVDLLIGLPVAAPIASFTTGQAVQFLEGNSGYTMAEVKVSLNRPCDPGKSCSVYYTTVPGGTAFSGVDFVATSGLLTFSGTQTQKSFFVKLVGDRTAEVSESFDVQLVAAQSKGVALAGPTVSTTLTILDDDNTSTPTQPGPTGPALLPQVSVDVKRDTAGNALPIYEGNTATFVVSLDKTSTQPVSVKYRTNQPSLVPVNTALAGADYLATSGTITFKPGERTKEFTVSILADNVAGEGVDRNADRDIRDYGEGEEFRVVLTEPMNADLAGGGAVGTATAANTTPAVTAFITDVYMPPAAPGFQITLNYLGDVPATVRSAAEWAAGRWSQVITSDLPAVIDPDSGTVIDDILIDVQMGLLDAVTGTDGKGGVLAEAGVDDGGYRTTGTGLPWKSSAGFDPADVNNPMLRQIVLHEFGHALGFMSDLFATKGVINAAGTGWVGANALREYRTIFGAPNALNVPLHVTGGPGSAGSHWRESVFGNELMTPEVKDATTLPLSRITVGAMQDLGYTVNYAKADAYTRPAATGATTTQTVAGVSNVTLAPVVSRPRFAALVAAASTQPAETSRTTIGIAVGTQPSAEAQSSGLPGGRRAAFARLARS